MSELTHWYLHVDLDAFFASVEQLDNPSYRGKPVIVGGKPEDRRGVVSTASYEARKYGVHSAMPTYQAYKLCPHGIYVHGRMKRYAELSFQIMSIFREFSPDVQQMSIDEAFIDLTGTEKLFGKPEETALKIKQIVKENTGLTVSVGLATTKYLAKIASGYSKPDGFYFIHKGDEEKFMLSLPLNKVWGLGPKSLDIIKTKGFKTTRDIYERDADTLKFLFGNNMGTFLYNVVRGNEQETFSKETKNHSISAETTFPYDLTDLYTIETKLLELAHGVFFRLLKESSYSRTAFVKIRYDDFSTCSIQKTEDKNILTLDSYFEIIKKLFEKKYDNTRGIRLLGVGFENVEDTEKPYQQDLFQNNDSKKQAVEQAILKLEKKHPEIKVRKARTFDTGKLKSLFLIPFLLLFPFKSYTKDNTVEQTGAGVISPDVFYTPSPSENENTGSLFDLELNEDNNIEYSLSGYWQASFSNTLQFSFGNNTVPGFSLAAPVFKQEVEFSSYFLLNKHWFFQADFADEFTKNTLSTGYKGDSFLRSLIISNRNVSIPKGYSADSFGFGLQGGKNQSPGISIHFQSQDNKLEIDGLIRYDMTKSNSATFYGLNQVNDKKIDIKDFLYGFCYQFPDGSNTALSDIKDIYVENRKGSYKDTYGRKYKKLSTSDYSFIASSNKLYFSPSAGAQKNDSFIPSVIVTFYNNRNIDFLIEITGDYNDSESFAGKIQKEFNSNPDIIFTLQDYAINPLIEVDNQKGLVIQSGTGFSPFLCLNIYDFGLDTASDNFVIDINSDLKQSDYLIESPDFSDLLYDDFFREKHSYSAVTNINYSQRFPFAHIFPEIYLNLPVSPNLQILQRNYTQISEFQIGTDACAGTVLVYKNNILDTGAVYNPNTGIVTLSSPPSTTDKIYITWQEDASDFINGSLSTGIGSKYHFTENLYGDLFLSAKWPLHFNSFYASSDDPQNGFAALSTGISYNTDNLNISNKTAISVQTDNATDGIIVCSQNDYTSQTYYLDSSSGYETKAIPYIHTSKEEIALSEMSNGTINNHSGITDSEISGYKIPLSWNFTNEKNWAAVDIKLDSGYLLQDSSQLNIALKTEDNFISANDCDLYLQLGVKADFAFYGEDSYNIPSWKIDNFNFNDSSWQLININLNNYDKAKLYNNYDARLVIINKSDNYSTGTIYIGPYEPVINSIKAVHSKDILTTTGSIKNSSNNYTSFIKWNINAATNPDEIEDTTITTTSYFKQYDFSSFGNIELEFGINAYNKIQYKNDSHQDGFILYLGSPQSNSINQNALTLHIYDISPYFSDTLTTKKLSIDIENKKIFIDNYEIPKNLYSLNINPSIPASVMKLSFNTAQNGYLYKGGSIYINNLTFTNSKTYTNIQNRFTTEFNKKGNIVSIGDFDLLKDFSIGIDSYQSLGDFNNVTPNITSNGNSKLTLSGIKLSGDLQLHNSSVYNAGHSFNFENPLFNILQINEQYRYNYGEDIISKNDEISISLADYNIPLNLTYSSAAEKQKFYDNQKSILKSSFQHISDTLTINNIINLSLNQKTNNSKINSSGLLYENYFSNWKDISEYQISNGNKDATERAEKINIELGGKFFNNFFQPEIKYELGGKYLWTTASTLEDKTNISLSLPFVLSFQSFTFNMKRTAGDNNLTIKSDSDSYLSDINSILEYQKNRKWIYSSIPFYELFTPDLTSNISANYSTQYEFLYKRKLFNDFKDLYIPSNVSFTVQRNILKNSNTSDLYQYKAVLTNISVNNFGTNSSKQLFKWFKQEEIISSFSGIIKLPADIPENISAQISAYLQLLLFLSDNNSISTAMDYSLESDFNWNYHTTFIYNRAVINGFMDNFIKIFSKTVFSSTTIVRDVFSAELSRKDNIFNQKYNYSHASDYKFMKYYTISTSLGGSFNYSENKACLLGLEISIGGKIEF